ncbi:MFS transporter [Actinomadura yumaensis]|uniref:MFS transporter n=1 Tax=Actinomadura TaxID=1988 RepID=UPI001322293A|nr:MFS transporter [Actinomadura sp. J1-007]MWK39822.1 MFS transporter [Actinomadura sp. J1-007]
MAVEPGREADQVRAVRTRASPRPPSAAAASSGALAVWGVLLIAANLRAGLTVVGPLLDTVQAELGLSPVSAGLLNSLPLLAFAVVSPLVPAVGARLGPERALAWAMVTLAAGTVLRSVPSPAALFAGTVLMGAGIAVGNVLLPSLIKRDFPHSIGMMTGAYAAVMGGAAAVTSGVAVPLGHAVGGWQGAWGSWAVAAVAALAVWRPQVPGRPAGPPAGARAARPRLPWRSGRAWAVTGFMGLQSFAFYTVVGWLPSLLHDHGVGGTAAGWLLFLFQAVAVAVGLVVPAFLRRTRDQRLPAAVSSLVCLGGYAGLLLAPQWAPVWSVVLGLGGGTCLVLALSFLSLRAADHASAGGLSAMAQSGGYLVAAAGPPVFGALHSATGGWGASLTLLCGAGAVQVLLALAAGRGTVAAVRQPPRSRR